jgi:hypothetical protein
MNTMKKSWRTKVLLPFMAAALGFLWSLSWSSSDVAAQLAQFSPGEATHGSF